MSTTKLDRHRHTTQADWHPPAAPKHPAKAGAHAPAKKHGNAKDKKKIDDTVAFIRKKLDDSGWFDTVTTGDLKQITARMKTLKPDQINQVVDKLSDGDLHKWADEAGSPWFGTGLNGDQKLDLFKTLVPGLNGKNLTRLGREATDADKGMADKEFILSVVGGANPDARQTYKKAITAGTLPRDDFKNQSSMLDPKGGLAKAVNKILGGEQGPNQLRELTKFLECFTPQNRADLLFRSDNTIFTPKVLDKLAEQLTVPDAETVFGKEEKQKLFDLLASSMTGSQAADMHSALAAHDFMRALDKAAELRRKTGQAQPVNSTDNLGEILENYTNRNSLQREANNRSNFSWLPILGHEAQSFAKDVVPHIPQFKATVPQAPVSPNGEQFFKSFLKHSDSNGDPNIVIDMKKPEYLTRISTHPVNPASKGKVKDCNLDLAADMVAERSAAIVYNKLRDNGEHTGRQLQLIGDIALRQQRIKKTDYFTEEHSARENGAEDALWVVQKAGKQIDEYARKFDLPRPLLAGILAAEVDFDTHFKVKEPKNAGLVNGIAFYVHSATDALSYLGDDKVKADLKEAKLDNALAYLNRDTTKKYIENIRKDNFDGYDDFLDDKGPMQINHASILTLQLAHQMWDAGKKIPETKTPANFGDFLKNMTASQMASIYRGYRAGLEKTGGYKHYDRKLGVYTVPGGEDFARAVNDPRAVMGYQAYQAEPYFAYYLKQFGN